MAAPGEQEHVSMGQHFMSAAARRPNDPAIHFVSSADGKWVSASFRQLDCASEYLALQLQELAAEGLCAGGAGRQSPRLSDTMGGGRYSASKSSRLSVKPVFRRSRQDKHCVRRGFDVGKLPDTSVATQSMKCVTWPKKVYGAYNTMKYTYSSSQRITKSTLA